MPQIAVVTDTTQYLPREVIERHGLHLVSLYVNWDGRTDRESDLADYDALLRLPAQRRRAAEHVAAVASATSSPSTSRWSSDGDDIVSIHLSGGISGTVRAAEQARDLLIERGMAAEKMVVVDSLTGCAGHGFMAVAAANAAAGGADLAGAVAAARKRCART